MIDTSLLFDLGLVIIAATVISLLMRLLKQPLVLGYVIGGFIIGPSLLRIVANPDQVQVLSELGIAFLLFIIGLELDVRKIKEVGAISGIVGFFQVSLTFGLGFAVAYFMGMGAMAAFYIGLAVAFSSTMVVIKLLADNKELESLHGQLVLGIMLIQDILAVFALSMLPSLNNLSVAFFGGFVLKVLALGVVLIVAARFVLPVLMRQVEHSSELLFLTSLSVIFAFGYLAHYLSFSIAIGAFFAGLALSASPLHLDIGAKIQSLRDFFLVMFFVTFGMQVSFDGIEALIVPVIVFVLVSTVGKAFITFSLLKGFRYGSRTAFLTAVQKAQVSEFSLVLVTVGLSLGHIAPAVTSLVTLVALITILLTPYIIGNDDRLFDLLARLIPRFKQEGQAEEELSKLDYAQLKGHVVLFGFYKMAPSVLRTLLKRKLKYVVVDHNPEKTRKLAKAGINSLCGSMANEEVYEKVHLEDAKVAISTVPHTNVNLLLLGFLKNHNKDCLSIVTARNTQDALQLYEAGATYVILPDSLGGQKVSNYLEFLTPKGIKDWGRKHVQSLKEEMAEGAKWD